MAEPAQGISVVIGDDEADPVRIDPVTGTVEHDQADGSVIVELDKVRKNREGQAFDANLAEKMDENELSRIGNELHQAISDDHDSRGNWLEIRARIIDFCGLQIKEPRANVGDTSAAVEGMSTVTNPLLLEGILKGWANAQAELLPSEGPAKIDEQDHETPQSDELAEALERDFNYYLTVTATEYYPDTSHMLLWGVYLGGSGFKKIYRCPMRRRPVSESVSPENLIVSDTMKDMRSCARITHQIEMRQSVMQRMKLLGAYRDTPATTPPPPTSTAVAQAVAGVQGTNPSPSSKREADRPYTLWECQCELDLPDYAPTGFKGEGIPLPYLVTLDKDSREVLAIRRDWNEDDEDAQRKRLYVKYPYVPGPGFYGTGLGHILGNCSAAMTAAWREALDAGMFANFPAFLLAKLGGRQNTSDYRLAAGTGTAIETNGMPIGNVVTNLPYRDVTSGLLTLIDKITAQAKELGGVADIPASEGVANVPVGTMLASIEQATKVMSAAHKGMHQAQAEELQMLVDLFRDHPEDFWKGNKKCKGFWDEAKFRAALENCSLVPRSDPNTPSHIHRVAKALALVQMLNSPALAQVMSAKEVALRALAVLREDPTNLIVDPMPQPAGGQGASADPLVGQARMISAQAQIAKVQQDGQTGSDQDGIGPAKTAGPEGHRDIAIGAGVRHSPRRSGQGTGGRTACAA